MGPASTINRKAITDGPRTAATVASVPNATPEPLSTSSSDTEATYSGNDRLIACDICETAFDDGFQLRQVRVSVDRS